MTPPHRPGLLIVPALAVITLIGPLALHMYFPALPAVKAEFGISVGTAQLTVSLVMLAMAFCTLAYGGLSDRFGRRPVLLSGLSLFTAGAVVCWLAPDIWTFLAGRLLQAGGAACGVVLARAIARDIFGMERLPQIIALLTAAYVLGPLLAPVAGGFLVDGLGWRTLFAAAAVVGGAILFAVFAVLPETKAPVRAGDGTLGVIAAYGKLLRVPRFIGLVLVPGLISGAFFTLSTAISFLALDVLHRSATDYGLWFIVLPVGFMAGSFVSARVGARATTRTMVMTGTSIAVLTVMTQIALLATGPMTMETLFIPGAFLGFAQGIAMPYAQTGAIAIDTGLAGTAAGAVVFAQVFFPAILQQLAGSFADGTWVPMTMIMLGATLLALVAGWMATRTPS